MYPDPHFRDSVHNLGDTFTWQSFSSIAYLESPPVLFFPFVFAPSLPAALLPQVPELLSFVKFSIFCTKLIPHLDSGPCLRLC